MGFHTWVEKCPCCGFEEMTVAGSADFHFEAQCPICGYAKWSEEKFPKIRDIQVAKDLLTQLPPDRIQESIELYQEDSIPLVERVKKELS